MQYLGGKHFLGKAISDVMLSQTREREADTLSLSLELEVC